MLDPTGVRVGCLFVHPEDVHEKFRDYLMPLLYRVCHLKALFGQDEFSAVFHNYQVFLQGV